MSRKPAYGPRLTALTAADGTLAGLQLDLLRIGPWLIAAAFIAVVVLVLDRRARAALMTRFRSEWGAIRDRRRDMVAIAAYSKAFPPTGAYAVDDRTWLDLNMDDVFSVIDRTESAIGQQRLYARLRSGFAAQAAAFDALVERFSGDAQARERAQLVLSRLGSPGAYDLWWIAESLDIPAWYAVFPVVTLAMAAAAVAVLVQPAALFFVFAGALIGVIVRARIASQLRVMLAGFRQITPLVAAARSLSALDDEHASPITGGLRDDAARLGALRRIAAWSGRNPAAAVSGNIVELVFEYVYLFLWLDATALFLSARQLRTRAPELLRLIANVGDTDAALSVASYRATAAGWTHPVVSADVATVELRDVRHPLLPDAVPNTITLNPPNGVLITGSNMSGKSTFLRTVGVTAILAQTIGTCLAARYQACPFVVRGCIGRADDPASGKSYYLVEVESVLALVEAANASVPHLMLFDELFRGTNAVERIAAGEAVLRTLVGSHGPEAKPHVVLAATHDLELTTLLADCYAAYHFADQVGETGLAFDYRLRFGPSTMRNAIALLAQRGAPAALVAHATRRAEQLDREHRATAGTYS